ncbi:hypothetical protein KBB12_03790 [Candidatus Woesebacteria bacterium]|nr:hypothetical protein [Candidatus Woesebacteria bacterium]
MDIKRILVFASIFCVGFLVTSLLLQRNLTGISQTVTSLEHSLGTLSQQKKQVVGFLPYWLIDKADKDYTKSLTTIAYFGLTVDSDGSIQQYTNPGESEPGWLALQSGKYTPPPGMSTSLVIFNGDPETINELISDPQTHASTLVDDILPILQEHKFTDLNLDLESVLPASESARLHFTAFVRQVREDLTRKVGSHITITIDASPTDLIKTRLIDLASVAPYVDRVVLMTYDYHYSGSYVTGPVAPLGGAGIYNEFDTETAIQKALEVLPPSKVILGIPLYGYQWESITNSPRAATIPGSGIAMSNRAVEGFLAECATCSAHFEKLSEESYLIYKDQETNTYHQIFYPDARSTELKTTLAAKYHIAGLALWAIGYEGNSILEPIASYLK